LANATWGDIPRHTPGRAGHTMAHSSTAKGRACAQECGERRQKLGMDKIIYVIKDK
jgi:hypothetical protein